MNGLPPPDRPSGRPLRAQTTACGGLARVILLVLLATSARADPGAFYILPYLQNVQTTRVTVQWWTEPPQRSPGLAPTPAPTGPGRDVADTHPDLAGTGRVQQAIGPDRVEFGPGLARVAPATNTLVPGVVRVLHRAVLEGLEPETAYAYRVRTGRAVSPVDTLRTAGRRHRPFRVAVLGDGRTDDDRVVARHRGIARLALARHADLLFHCGDAIDTGDQVHWDRLWRRILTPSDPADPGLDLAGRIPVYLVVGNHEIYAGGMGGLRAGYDAGNLTTTMARFRAYVDVPANGSARPDWEERYYAFTWGVATFIVMDTNNTSDDDLDNHTFLPDGSTPDWEPGSRQYDWLLETLAQARDTSAFTFVLMHPSPYSQGTHGSPDESQSGWPVRALDPVFRQYGVDAVLTSHDHVVERCLTGPPGFEETMDDTATANLNYLVMGNSGHSARGPAPGWQTWMDITGNDGPPYHTRYFYDWAGTDHASYIDLSVRPLGQGRWAAHLRFVRDDGAVFDPLTLQRRDPRWHPPGVR